jgi:hypothetical protein
MFVGGRVEIYKEFDWMVSNASRKWFAYVFAVVSPRINWAHLFGVGV